MKNFLWGFVSGALLVIVFFHVLYKDNMVTQQEVQQHIEVNAHDDLVCEKLEAEVAVPPLEFARP